MDACCDHGFKIHEVLDFPFLFFHLWANQRWGPASALGGFCWFQLHVIPGCCGCTIRKGVFCFFCFLRLPRMPVCHTNSDLLASYLIRCGQDFILCQSSQRLQWKKFPIFVYFLTSKEATENSSKEIAMVVFSVVFVFLMESVIGLRMICLVKMKTFSREDI